MWYSFQKNRQIYWCSSMCNSRWKRKINCSTCSCSKYTFLFLFLFLFNYLGMFPLRVTSAKVRRSRGRERKGVTAAWERWTHSASITSSPQLESCDHTLIVVFKYSGLIVAFFAYAIVRFINFWIKKEHFSNICHHYFVQ